MDDTIGQRLEQAGEILRRAQALVFTAGAGMGVDSGLPDFRGNEGFWRAYPVAAKLGLSFSELANPKWFHRSPGLAWAFYGHRFNLYGRTLPHAGFSQLLQLGRAKPGGYFVFTSNVDGHFQKAGFDPDKIVECHGSIRHLQCLRVCSEQIWEAPGREVPLDIERFEALPPLPACPACGGLARPNILMFADAGWLDQRTSAQEASMVHWLLGIRSAGSTLAIIEIGAGTAVPTVRWTSESLAREYGATLIRINPRESEVPGDHISLPLGAAEGIRRLIEAARLGP